MVSPIDIFFMRLQAARSSKYKLLIATDATDADASIAFAELQNTMEMEQAVFDKPS